MGGTDFADAKIKAQIICILHNLESSLSMFLNPNFEACL